MDIRPEVLPFVGICLAVFLIPGIVSQIVKRRKLAMTFYSLALLSTLYMLYFFRDPQRDCPQNPNIVLASADGKVMTIKPVEEEKYLKQTTTRISIFLSLLDVHVNRAPFAGESAFLGNSPGKRYFTFQEKSSEYNQHNAIMFENDRTKCLVYQIVGPVARRVVYWLDKDEPQQVEAGTSFGMMKFGSRLDMYMPVDDIEVLVKPGDRVVAGITPVARIIRKEHGANNR